jgi:hypothetical protein
MEQIIQTMKKNLLRYFSNQESLTFAIRREQLKNGKEKLTPVVKGSGILAQWTPIVKVNDTFQATDIYNTFTYTEKDCVKYIQGFKEQLANEKGSLVSATNYQEVF